MQNLILASSSPRRKELLENLQLSFNTVSSDVDEHYDPEWKPDRIVMELAFRKAKFVFKDYPASFVIGSDTVVVNDNHVLGKPQNREEAFSMLKSLSGKTHSVYTGVAIVTPTNEQTFFEKTDVVFWELSDEEINKYLDTGEPFDKAGSYGIQGFGRLLVKGITGDYFSVVGLPVARTMRELIKAGYVI
ncbi:septum formation inhibitor Maf [Bacillus sp. V3B]|uniref:Maf family protein n=1 Tax=Bacillus sp. V3B TaxID=2804915 RepID=UPI00210DBBCC|nr:Maf family protein [Bacillus sp. V3B]MCQ6273523.1 septum formation inhibitor Maf [Bacillus sp. V3B]